MRWLIALVRAFFAMYFCIGVVFLCAYLYVAFIGSKENVDAGSVNANHPLIERFGGLALIVFMLAVGIECLRRFNAGLRDQA